MLHLCLLQESDLTLWALRDTKGLYVDNQIMLSAHQKENQHPGGGEGETKGRETPLVEESEDLS